MIAIFDSAIQFDYRDTTISFVTLTILNNGYSAAMIADTASTLTAENLNSGILP